MSAAHDTRADAARFLRSLAQAVATIGLYPAGHPSRARLVDTAHEHLLALHEGDPHPRFSFLEQEVVYGEQAMRELRDWPPAARLSTAGMQRVELPAPVSREEFEGFLDDVLGLLGHGGATTVARPERRTGIRFGAVGLRGEASLAAAEPIPVAGLSYTLADEAATVRWLHDEVGTHGGLHLLEAEATVRSLSVAMHAESRVLLPLLELKEFDQYTTTHAMNVAVLAMALAEYIGLGASEVRAYGVAGLLHDLGKVRIPREILTKPGKLTDAEREVMQRHPADGARLLLASDRNLDLAATVAYEHHIMIDGGGYPCRHFRRDCHPASRLVHVCDVYDALRTNRPYRDAWDSPRVLAYLEERSGSEFDAGIVRAFVAMMREWDRRVVRVATPAPPSPS
jgi:putative nucleotidyltransferase with HDIG domain